MKKGMTQACNKGGEHSDLFERLAAPYDPSEIEWRVGSTTKDKSKGMALAYQTARAVANRLDAVVGPENWRDEYRPWGENGVLCSLSLRVGGEWISKEDGADNTDFEATKGGISDAFKRAATKWGLGRYLYGLDSPWVTLEKGKYIAKSELPKLRKILEALKAGTPGPAIPPESKADAVATFPDGFGPSSELPKGEHKGVALRDVPTDYLARLADEGSGVWAAAAAAELSTRSGERQCEGETA